MNILQQIASTIQAIDYCEKNGKNFPKHYDTLRELENSLPHGAGIDNGVKIDRENSSQDKIVLTFSYHHMNDGGYYVGWSDYKIAIRPTFAGFDMKITGKNVNDIKDYLYDVFDVALREELEVNYV
jgi:hypothetical protein